MNGARIQSPARWWTEEYQEPASGSTWRRGELPAIPGRTRLEIIAEETAGGVVIRRCDIPALGGLDGVQLRRLRVAIDRAIRIVEDSEGNQP
ncbi:MAG: hypothetical protein LKI58_11225 [Actinomyces sp.]|jgi:hypothetical protein|nr:hypothetical protein [Actinomyces sp.]MCI1788610.1 hypothetical protein [Actinomyces sp.]MCI1829712.1 hypothetical protein [Actinomyces sp.]